MATNGKAALHGSATHPARVPRNMLAAIMGQPTVSHANSASATTRGGAYGVVAGGDFLVTSTGSLGYSVAAGRLVAVGTFATAQGAYAGYNDAAVTGNVGARHATLTRVDYIAYRVRDTDEDATGAEDDGIVVIAGTAGSGAPSVPSSLGTLVILCEVSVPSTAAGTALTFTDRRMFATAIGGIVRTRSTLLPSGSALWEGLYVDESDSDILKRYNGSAFDIISEPWVPWTPGAIAQGVTLSFTLVEGYYVRHRNTWEAACTVTFTSAGTAANGLFLQLPLTIPSAEAVKGTFLFDDSGTGFRGGWVYPESTSSVSFKSDNSTDRFGVNPAITVAINDQLRVWLSGRF